MLDGAKLEQLRGLLHQSPRAFGHARSTWTLTLLAQVAHDQGLSATVLSDGDNPAGVGAAGGMRLEARQALAHRPPIPTTRVKKVAATA